MTANIVRNMMLAQRTMISGISKDANIEGAVDAAVNNAVNKLWIAHNWFFRRTETTLTTPSAVEYVDLPTNYRTFGYLEFANGQFEGHQIAKTSPASGCLHTILKLYPSCEPFRLCAFNW